MPINDNANSIISEGSFFQGKYAIKGSLRIEGKFEGSSLLVDQLMVGPRGKVKSNITANSVVIEGTVIGNIESSSRILLLPTARVLGDLKTPELIIQDGVILEGKCTISHTNIDNTRKYIEELYSREE